MALLKGTLEVLVLKALSWGPLHGFEIARWLEDRSEGQLDIEDAALLQALHRLEERQLLSADWGITENNRKARYYQLTANGRAHLKDESVAVRESALALANILTLKSPALRGGR